MGGPAPWYTGGASRVNDFTDQSYGRMLRSTKFPINSVQFPIADDEDNDMPFGSQHPGGAQFVFADGHVTFLSETIDMDAYQALSTREGGETVEGVTIDEIRQGEVIFVLKKGVRVRKRPLGAGAN